MVDEGTVLRLKEKHEALYNELLQEHMEGALEDEARRAQLNSKVDALLAELGTLASLGLTISEYNWLSSALMRWQAASVILKKRRLIEIPSPPSPSGGVLRPDRRAWTQAELGAWLRDKAFEVAKIRRRADLVEQLERAAREASSGEAMHQDWRQAKVHLAREVLNGALSFKQFTAGAYPFLEEVWVDEVKELMAYFLWRDKGSPLPGDADGDYLAACEILHDRLVQPAMKATLADFAEARAYLESEFLTADKLDLEKPGTKVALASKADRLKARWADESAAESYAKTFYENIVPAVMDKGRESVRAVLGVLDLGRASSQYYRIINCFETALAVYFLDGDLVREIESAASGASEIT